MVENEIINLLIIAENILGIYRNFSYLPKRHQVLIIIRTSAEVTVSFVLFSNRVFFISEKFWGENLMPYVMITFHFVVLISGFIIIIGGIHSSCDFKIFINKYMSVQTCFRNEPTYTKCLKRLKIFFILASSIFLFICTGNLLLKVTTKYYLQKEKFLLSYFMLMVVEMMHEMRFMLEHVVLYSYITMLRSFLKCLNQYISLTQIEYDHIEKRYKDRNQTNEILTTEEVEHWAKKYECLVLCSKNLSMCFRMQMRFALVFSSIHYVTTAYGIFSIILTRNIGEYLSGVNISYVLLFSIFCTFLVVSAGQNVVNEWSETHRNLSKLYSILSIEPSASETKSVKNLNLLVKVNPIKIEYTNKIHIGMYMIPLVLSLSLSYVITALQLNHII